MGRPAPSVDGLRIVWWSMPRLLRPRDPARDRGPRSLERVAAHEQPDVAAGDHRLLDLRLGRAEIFLGVEHLLARRDVVGLAGEQVDRAGHVLEVEPLAEPDELASGESVLLEQLDDRLKIEATRQVDRALVPARERLLLGEVRRVVDVLVEIDVLP